MFFYRTFIYIVTLTCDLFTSAVTYELPFIHATHVPIFSILYDYAFLSYRRLNLIISASHWTVTAHAPYHVTYHMWAKIHIFEIPDRNLPIHLVTFGADTTKKKPCYRRKLVKIAFFPLRRLQSSLRMRSIMWPVHRQSPKTTLDDFSPISLCNFYGATMTSKDSLYYSIPMLKGFAAAKKLSSQNRSP